MPEIEKFRIHDGPNQEQMEQEQQNGIEEQEPELTFQDSVH